MIVMNLGENRLVDTARGGEGAYTHTHTLSGNKIMKVKITRSCPTLCDPIDIQSMEFFRPEYWSGQPFPFPGYLPNPEIEPRSPVLQADSLPADPQGKPKDSRKLLNDTENPVWCSVMTQKGAMGIGEGGTTGKGYIL